MDRVYGLFAQYVDGEKEYRVYEGEVIKEIATGKGTQTFVDFGRFKYCYAETDFGKTAFATQEEAQREEGVLRGILRCADGSAGESSAGQAEKWRKTLRRCNFARAQNRGGDARRVCLWRGGIYCQYGGFLSGVGSSWPASVEEGKRV